MDQKTGSTPQIFQELERGRYSSIGIIASNPYDRLFLAYKVREVCPDALLAFTSSTSLYTHHDIVPYLRGSLVVSTYPLQLANQSWSPGPAARAEQKGLRPTLARVGFPHYDSEGIYNATVAQLAEMLHCEEKVNDTLPALLDYRFPDGDGDRPDDRLLKSTVGEMKVTDMAAHRRDEMKEQAGRSHCTTRGRVPPVWVSIVGERGLYPLAVTEPKTEQYPFEEVVYRSPYPVARSKPGELAPKLGSSWVAVYFVLAGAVALGAAWYLWVCLASGAGVAEGWRGWVRVGARPREILDSAGGRRLAALTASVALWLVILAGLPAWGTALIWVKRGVEWPSPFKSESWEDWARILVAGYATIVVLAVLLGTVALLLAVIRLVFARASGCPSPLDRWFGACVATAASLVGVLALASVLACRSTVDSSPFPVANLRLDCERMSRLTNGVSPLVPLLLIGLAGVAALFGGWRRIELRNRLCATKAVDISPSLSDAIAQQTFGRVRYDLAMIRDMLATPLVVGTRTDPWLLPGVALVLLTLALSFGHVPGSLERWPLHLILLSAFLVAVMTVALWLTELIGLKRVAARLSRAVAQLPMVRAFDRLPTTVTFTGLSGPLSSAGAEEGDPLIDRQFQAVAEGYGRVRSGLEAHGPGFPQCAEAIESLVQRLRENHSPGLPPAEWWNAVDALLPILAPFWALRSATTAYGTARAAAEGAHGSDQVLEELWPDLADVLRPDGRVVDESGRTTDRTAGEAVVPDDGHSGRAATATRIRRPELRTQPEEVRRWLCDAEDLIALVLARQLAWLRRYGTSMKVFLVVGLFALTLSVTSYPFQPQGQMLTVLGCLSAVTVATVVMMAVQSSRDDVSSRISRTPPNRFTFDRQFATTLVSFVLPLLGLLGMLSYGISDVIRSWLEPLFR